MGLAGLLSSHCNADPLAHPPRDELRQAWQKYRQSFIAPEGRVVDNANGDISHSEGQGYGMLLAERFDDRETFERIWRWTSEHLLIRGDGLAAWRWDPKSDPRVADRNNASDGDVLIAWALSEAADKWSVPDYGDASRRTVKAIAAKLIVSSHFGPILLPGADGFDVSSRADGPVVNLSYWIFPAFNYLGRRPGPVDWARLSDVGLRLIAAARFGPRQLPTNWVSLAHENAAPAASFPRVFGYDAIRIPLYLAWGSHRDMAAALSPGPAVVEVDSGKDAGPFSDPDYQAIATLATCVGAQGVSSGETAYSGRFYYPATLYLLSRIAADDVAPICAP
ncbi:glycosyl hydrolase family 8 [Bradyrhizobium sp. CER78]|uniref:glycosyl hydrolase family 8 n=1 Tax=Bradyrhizobium sp. CER78 TaxID=3039162 RepID=UPI0024488221|nr:glycosyl hydrolase family 8 [Bradyrhizobium sp. CER78]MDH2383020.1 glycosyl hydrolase family 8 [Bradyrhizobium sp. CER78]